MRSREAKVMTIKEIDGKRLSRKSGGVYEDEGGGVYRLVPVDRDYTGKKAPVYFLQRIRDGKAEYISGVFKTKRPEVLSIDLKDSLGVKVYFDMVVQDGGDSLRIAKRPAKKRAAAVL